jgi:hypothetical protein
MPAIPAPDPNEGGAEDRSRNGTTGERGLEAFTKQRLYVSAAGLRVGLAIRAP